MDILYLPDPDNIKRENIETENDFIFVKSDRRYLKVIFSDILYIEGMKNYVTIHTVNKKIMSKIYLSEIINLLPPKIFFRINKSNIVNLRRIDSFENNDVSIGNWEIAIGNVYKEEFFQKFTI